LAKINPDSKTRVRRAPHKASDDRDELLDLLDKNLVAHVGFIAAGSPVVIPMAYGRVQDKLLLHGSSASRLMRALADGTELAVSITELNAVVAARSTYESSMHYRSAVIFGRARLLKDDEKLAALRNISDAILPGRSAEVRDSSAKELLATLIVELPLTEFSLKISNGPVKDNPADLGQGVWAGIIPLLTTAGEPVAADPEAKSLPVPESVREFQRRFG
jgi:nitroimidazol reductase NimA-like FMN-containing flavoprotein (pyridoxamine 5'-phosphate oxidase superfamily)